MNEIVKLLLREQTDSGAFRSWVRLPIGPLPDENGFVTALVLREISLMPPAPEFREIVHRAEAFLLRCQSGSRPFTFSFWPSDGYPKWMNQSRLYEDADDSAILALLLADLGVWDQQQMAQTASQLLQHRNEAGAVLTWLGPSMIPNTVDWCVNTNVAALLARAGMRNSVAYSKIVDGVESMVFEAVVSEERNSVDRLKRALPYYPHPIELLYALEHAVRCGAQEFSGAAAQLRRLEPLRKLCADPPADFPVCSSADGRIVWSAPVLQSLRRTRSAAPRTAALAAMET